MFCGSCGEYLPDDATMVCPKCGKSQLTDVAVPVQAQAQPAQIQTAPQPTQEQAAEVCEVRYEPKIGFWGGGECALYAVAIGPRGPHDVAHITFKLSAPCKPQHAPEFQRAVDAMTIHLLEQGWQSVGSATYPIRECGRNYQVTLPRFQRRGR